MEDMAVQQATRKTSLMTKQILHRTIRCLQAAPVVVVQPATTSIVRLGSVAATQSGDARRIPRRIWMLS
jgi:hypothetical protein